MEQQSSQDGATAGGDIVGRDKITAITPRASVVERLVHELEKEINDEKKTQEFVEHLKKYYVKKAHDGINGLESKLKHSGRAHEIPDALEKKEMFSKLLEKYSLYGSAQKVFALLLSRAEHEFSQNILPTLHTASVAEVNLTITQRIVEPTVEQCGSGALMMPHGVALGMVYWLAEQCFVRWHQ